MRPLSVFFGIVFASVFTSCGNNENAPREVPDGILSQDSMAYFISQVHLIDAASRQREIKKGNLQVYAKRGFIEYFDTAKVSRGRFLKSLEFWGDDFDDMAEVYDIAMERLSTQAAQLKKEEVERKSSKERD
jgi:hypothetical protein